MWQNFMARPSSEKSLLEGAVLISQWGQMELESFTSLQEVQQTLDNVVDRVKQLVHSKTISAHVDDPRTVRQILDCVNQVLYDEMGFQGNTDYYFAHQNSYIDRVKITFFFTFKTYM
jgi:F-box protein 21